MAKGPAAACYTVAARVRAMGSVLTDLRADAHPRTLASPVADYVRFIVLGDARTGSYMLVQALDSHPNITCFSELFYWQLDYVDFNVAAYDNNSPEDRALRDQDFERFLR